LFEEGWQDALAREQNGGQHSQLDDQQGAEPYTVSQDTTAPVANGEPATEEEQPAKAVEVIEDLVEKAKDLVIGGDSAEPVAGKPF
jgi:hypothetical protein